MIPHHEDGGVDRHRRARVVLELLRGRHPGDFTAELL
jgi:hypothetical protein